MLRTLWEVLYNALYDSIQLHTAPCNSICQVMYCTRFFLYMIYIGYHNFLWPKYLSSMKYFLSPSSSLSFTLSSVERFEYVTRSQYGCKLLTYTLWIFFYVLTLKTPNKIPSAICGIIRSSPFSPR